MQFIENQFIYPRVVGKSVGLSPLYTLVAAMIGGTDENVIKLAQECDVDVANFNCPGQTVVSGTEEGVPRL